jgi:uncharacterized protein (UPF0332 family)
VPAGRPRVLRTGVAMTGRDFLPLARRLAGGSDEAEWRTAVSQAYYAAFHVARDLLTGLGFRVPRADRAHDYLYRRLNNGGLTTVQFAADRLLELRRLRNWVDYDVGRPYTRAAATSDVVTAERIIQTLDALTPVDRTQITDAMKLYEQQIGDVTWHP